jgi:hypothetical protein
VGDFIWYIWKESDYIEKHVHTSDDENNVLCLSVNQQNPIKLELNQDLKVYIPHEKCESCVVDVRMCFANDKIKSMYVSIDSLDVSVYRKFDIQIVDEGTVAKRMKMRRTSRSRN